LHDPGPASDRRQQRMIPRGWVEGGTDVRRVLAAAVGRLGSAAAAGRCDAVSRFPSTVTAGRLGLLQKRADG
jgi:hypothetical protein